MQKAIVFILFHLSSIAQDGTIGSGGDDDGDGLPDTLNVSLNFNPNSIPSGGTSLLSLSVSGNLGPVICSFVGLPQPQGIVSPPISFNVTAVTTLSVSALCQEQAVFGDIPARSGFANTQLNINGAILPPIVESSFMPNAIELGQTTSFTWTSTGASTCITSGAVPGEVGEVDRQENFTPSSTGTFEATVTCSNDSGSSSSSSTVTVSNSTNPPVVIANYNPSFLPGSGFSNLSWDSQNADSCIIPSISGNFEHPTSGTFINQFIVSSTFTQVICNGTGGTGNTFAPVTVLASRSTEGSNNNLNTPNMMSVSPDFNAVELSFDADLQIDKVLLQELGLSVSNNEFSSLAIDLNDDKIDDRLIFSVSSKTLYIMINDNGAFTQINRVINGVSRIQDITSINVSNSGVVSVQVTQ